MYILISDELETGQAMTSAAHGSLMCYLQYMHNPRMAEWLASSFKKVICKVKVTDLENAMAEAGDGVWITESRLGNSKVGAVFLPREEWPQNFRYYKLWR